MSLPGSPESRHAAQLAADHYSSAVAMLRMAGDTTNSPEIVAGRGGPRTAMLLGRASVYVEAAMFCAKAAELGIDLRTQQEQDAERKQERVAAGLDCATCGHPHFDHLTYPGGVGPRPDITALQYTHCSQCGGASAGRSGYPAGPCA